MSNLMHTGIQVHYLKIIELDSECVNASVCVSFTWAFSKAFMGRDGISPVHPSQCLDAHEFGRDNFSITTQVSKQRRTPACCILLNSRGGVVGYMANG